MNYNTLEDIELAFPDEESARKYMFDLRWGKYATCPFCNNAKAYFIEKGTRCKCANKECYKKFSVTVKTILEATNIKLNTWVKIFYLYSKTRGRISSLELSNQVGISGKTEFLVRDRLDYIWNYTDTTGKFGGELMEVMIKSSFSSSHYEIYRQRKDEPYYKNPYHISEITDIGDPKQYNILIRYTRYFVNVYCTWIFLDFAAPEEILTETFLYMRDNGIKEYNAESILKHIWLVTGRMWFKFLREHPKYSEYQRNINRRCKQRTRMNLGTSYLVEIIFSKKSNTLTRREIRADRNLLNDTKKRIIERRGKLGTLYDFHSHFE